MVQFSLTYVLPAVEDPYEGRPLLPGPFRDLLQRKGLSRTHLANQEDGGGGGEGDEALADSDQHGDGGSVGKQEKWTKETVMDLQRITAILMLDKKVFNFFKQEQTLFNDMRQGIVI